MLVSSKIPRDCQNVIGFKLLTAGTKHEFHSNITGYVNIDIIISESANAPKIVRIDFIITLLVYSYYIV